MRQHGLSIVQKTELKGGYRGSGHIGLYRDIWGLGFRVSEK